MPYAKGLDLSSLRFADATHQIIGAYVIEKESANERIRPSELFELLEEDCVELNEIFNFNYEDKLTGEIGQRFFEDSVKALQVEQIEREIAAYTAKLGEETDAAARKEIMRQIAERTKRRNQLKK